MARSSRGIDSGGALARRRLPARGCLPRGGLARVGGDVCGALAGEHLFGEHLFGEHLFGVRQSERAFVGGEEC